MNVRYKGGFYDNSFSFLTGHELIEYPLWGKRGPHVNLYYKFFIFITFGNFFNLNIKFKALITIRYHFS